MIERPKKEEQHAELPPCMIYVDKEGTWFHNGIPIIHRGFLHLFYQSLCLDEHGCYIIKFKGQVCRLDVEDTPFVILRTNFVPACRNEETDRFILHIIDDTREELAPETLFVGPNHVPYCMIRGGEFPARFSRPGYYQLAEHVQEDPETGQYFLFLNSKRYYIG